MERRGITWARYFLLPGFCGGLTTFSGVTFEVMRDGGSGFIYLVASVVGSLIAVAVVMPISRRVIAVKP
jgi:CrcB protein